MTEHDLDPLSALFPDVLEDLPQGVLALSGRAAIRDACLRLAQGARRELLIFSRDLDPDLYDQAPFLEQVQRLALATSQLPVRILVRDPKAPVTGGHRLIALARQLSSRLAIRRVADDFRDRPDAFLIADRRGYCLRRFADRPEAIVDYAAPGEASRLRAELEQIWEQSDVDTELRRLYL
jgi:hypothetical protein